MQQCLYQKEQLCILMYSHIFLAVPQQFAMYFPSLQRQLLEIRQSLLSNSNKLGFTYLWRLPTTWNKIHHFLIRCRSLGSNSFINSLIANIWTFMNEFVVCCVSGWKVTWEYTKHFILTHNEANMYLCTNITSYPKRRSLKMSIKFCVTSELHLMFIFAMSIVYWMFAYIAVCRHNILQQSKTNNV